MKKKKRNSLIGSFYTFGPANLEKDIDTFNNSTTDATSSEISSCCAENFGDDMNLSEKLNYFDLQALDEGVYADIKNLYEYVEPTLDAQDKTELRNLLNSPNVTYKTIMDTLNSKMQQEQNESLNESKLNLENEADKLFSNIGPNYDEIKKFFDSNKKLDLSNISSNAKRLIIAGLGIYVDLYQIFKLNNQEYVQAGRPSYKTTYVFMPVEKVTDVINATNNFTTYSTSAFDNMDKSDIVRSLPYSNVNSIEISDKKLNINESLNESIDKRIINKSINYLKSNGFEVETSNNTLNQFNIKTPDKTKLCLAFFKGKDYFLIYGDDGHKYPYPYETKLYSYNDIIEWVADVKDFEGTNDVTESLNEASFWGYNYTYSVRYDTQSRYDVLFGGSNDYENAQEIAKHCADEIFSNPWESSENKFKILDSIYIANDDKEDEDSMDCMSFETEEYIDNLMSELASKKDFLNESLNDADFSIDFVGYTSEIQNSNNCDILETIYLSVDDVKDAYGEDMYNHAIKGITIEMFDNNAEGLLPSILYECIRTAAAHKAKPASKVNKEDAAKYTDFGFENLKLLNKSLF